MATENGNRTNIDKLGLVGAIVTGFFASACCIGPLVMVFLGISSAGALAALAPYRPFFLTLTLIFLGAVGYFTYRKASKADCHGRSCQLSNSKKGKVFFWGGVLFVLALLFFPQLMLMFMD